MARLSSFFAALALAAVPAVASAQNFVVDGVIHDARTLQPLAGVAVFVLDDQTGAVVSPRFFGNPDQQGQVTGPDGRYDLTLRTPIRVRLSLERPSEQFAFPSRTKPPAGATPLLPLGGLACSEVPCSGGQLANQAVPAEGQSYALRFDTASGSSARNNHIPVDALKELIQVKLTADRPRARIGDFVGLTIEIKGSLPNSVLGASTVLVMPEALRFMANTARAVAIGSNGRAIEQPLVPQQQDLQLRFSPTLIPAGDSTQYIRLLARVVAKKHDAKLELRSYVERGGGIAISNESIARLSFDEDPVLEQSTIFGSVFCEDDEGRPGWRDEPEAGLFGARVYLDNGFSVASDLDGLFHFSNVSPGQHLVKLDENALPPGSKALGPTRVQLHLTPGVPAKVRFPIHCELDVVEDPTKTSRGAKQASLEEDEAEGEPRELELSVDFSGRTFNLGGREDAFLSPVLEGHPSADDPLRLRFVPRLDSARTVTRWLIRVEEVDQEGRSLRTVKEPLTGRGLPPPFVDLLIDRSGAYRAQLEVEAGDYDTARSRPIDVVTSTATKQTIEQKTLLARIASEAEAKNAAASVTTVDRVIIEGHWDAAPDAVAQSRAFAEKVKAALIKAGMDAVPMEIVAKGVDEPLVPSISPRAKKQNRRVELYSFEKVEVPAKKRRPPKTAEPNMRSFSATVDGIEADLPISEEPISKYSLDLDIPAQVELRFEDGRGGSAVSRRVVTRRRVVRPGDRVALVPRVNVKDGRLLLGELELPLPVFSAQVIGVASNGKALSVELASVEDPEMWRLTLEDRSGRVLAEAANAGRVPSAVVLTSTTALEEPTVLRFVASTDAYVRIEQQPIALPPLKDGLNRQLPRVALSERVRIGDDDLPEAGADVSERVLSVGDGDRVLIPLVELEELPRATEPGATGGESGDASAPKDSAAAQLTLLLPREGETLSELEVPIRGETLPGNKITVNDEPVLVHADGRFATLVPLEPGRNTVVIESEDELGNRARWERAVETSSTSYFLMALGDVVLSGRDANLAGSNEHTRVNFGDAALDARGVAFGKARFVLDGPFKRISVLGRVDTGELGKPELLRESNDPLRLLPAFGDASLEQQEIPGHRALHLELRADQSHLILGSAATTLSAFGDDSLFSYRRAGFGLHAEVAKSFGEDDETRVQGVFTFGERGVRRGHDELQGTGGAFYWLSNHELVEGSEHVRVVVRDRDTGMVLASEEQTRGEDYELRPREGRLTLTQPLPHVAGGAMVGWNRSLALAGHPIYLVVDYEYESDAIDEKSFGVELREQLFDVVELYGALAGEQHVGEDYRLYGLGVAWRPAPRSSVELEWARSAGSTSYGALSLDGGLTFGSLAPVAVPQRVLDTGADAFFAGMSRDAVSIAATVSFADVMQRSDLSAPDSGYLRAYGAVTGMEFSSMSAGREAGRLKVGAGGRYAISDAFAVRASLDSAVGLTPEGAFDPNSGEIPAMQRTMVVAGFDWSEDKNAVTGELGYLDTAAPSLKTGAGGVSLRYERALRPNLRLSIAQDLLVGDDPLLPEGAGRAGTTLGISFAPYEALTLSVAEMVRFNGDNATQLGLKTRIDENFSTYVAERFSDNHDGTRLTTIIGAEDSVGENSRSYGEYQIDGASAEAARIVLGMDNRWRVSEGVELSLSFERMQRVRDSALAVTGARFRGPLGGLAYTLAPFDSTFLSDASVSRDALSLGFTFTRLERLKLASRFELRSENGAEGRDYLIFGTHNGFALSIHRDVTLLGRLTWQRANDTALSRRHAELFEWSVGGALRPKAEDWLTLLVRYTRQLAQRPLGATPLGLARVEQRDALSIEPIVDTPWNVQLVEKVALVASRAEQDGEGRASGLDALWINRINARFLEQFEAGLEYRMLIDLALETAERGFLIEAGWIPDERVRVGVGYNFTSFSDEVLTATNRDAGGPFLRLTGRY